MNESLIENVFEVETYKVFYCPPGFPVFSDPTLHFIKGIFIIPQT